ncbi:MAG: Uma2 family endonuclease [Bacteroidetes bacterium]|jgi:Uma2 family endonuclease|nr:Uma2 family endonuclease [Bacteroidota bacterium]
MATKTASLWRRALHDPQLQDLPFKIETNEHGQLVLSPHNPYHSRQQSQLLRLLDRHAPGTGEVIIEFSVETSKGIKVPDVVWISKERWAQIPEEAEASPVMPELCVEVRSNSNTDDEMTKKRQLYFESGADEVWTCAPDGRVRFFDAEHERPDSTLAPSFPASIA